MSDSYYNLVDADDPHGEKFTATDMVRSTWTAKIQHGAPVSAPLAKGKDGIFRGHVPWVRPGDRYRYRIDGKGRAWMRGSDSGVTDFSATCARRVGSPSATRFA